MGDRFFLPALAAIFFLATDCRIAATGYRLQATGYRLQATGYRLQASRDRLFFLPLLFLLTCTN
jgi:hypothetical protein